MNWDPSDPLAVRLARVAHPVGDWFDTESNPPEAMDQQDRVVSRSRYFTLDDLNDLALVERSVVEAGMEHALIAAISTVIGSAHPRGSRSVRVSDLYTATAAQRVAALDALFTASPDLYARLTGND